jgi:hypothetical protein
MLSYKKRLDLILGAAQDIASREFQEEAWFPGGKFVSSPDEVYQVLMEDSKPDLFFETYGKTLSKSQLQSWREFRSRLEHYYDSMPLHSDPRRVLEDPEWALVREAAQRFVSAFQERPTEGTDTSVPGAKP